MIGIVPEKIPDGTVSKQGISLREIAFTLFRWRWIILAIALPIIGLGGISLFRQTGAFTAACRVVVELKKVDLPQWNTSGRAIDYDRELSTLTNIAMSLPVAELATAALRDSLPVISGLDHHFVGMDEKDLLEFLVHGLEVSAVGESNILEFRFTSIHPRISLMASGALRDAFEDFHIHGRKTKDALTYYDEQISTVRAEIDSLLNLRGKTMVEEGYSSLIDDLRNDTGRLANIRDKYMMAAAKTQSLRSQYDHLRKFLDKDPREFPIGKEESMSQSLVSWRNIVGKHESELYRILTIHTDDSTPARRQRQLLNSALERLRREESAYVESIYLEMRASESLEAILAVQIKELEQKNSRGPVAYQRISLLDVESESLRSLLKDLQGKRGEVRLTQDADERVSSVVVLTDPAVISIMSGGKTMVYFIMISVFALALGVVAAFLIDNMDHRVFVPKDVEENLKLPVFASVTRKD